MTKTNGNARHMRQTTNNARGIKGRVVALALAGVLAIGGVGAFCIAGVGKSPGQAPVAAQTAQAQTTVKTATTKKNDAEQAETKKAETKKNDTKKQTTTKSNTKPATQQTAKPAPKPAPTPTPAPQQQQQTMTTQSSEPGMEVKVSREGAIAMACDHVGAGGQAKGDAQNVKTSDLITGGGTKYYVVDFDLGDVHYSVNVNVVDGNVISAEESHAGVRQLLNENGEAVEGTQQPVDA